ncbi:unnamed protein product [Citrullus colocynthis]|uniref:Phloem filament PP1 domain-containing protein n=1 Tax=Citrullus colocynthis TaxID=252529 RepID=A0ABP0XQL5_9ROSI
MSCEPFGKWIQIPETSTPCVKDIANHATNVHNKQTGDNLIFVRVIAGWFLELDEYRIKHRLYIEVTNSKGEVVIYEAVVVVEERDGNRVRTLISFELVIVDERDPLIFWKKIPDVHAACVQEVVEYVMKKNNEDTNDNLKYVSTTEGWYYEVNPNAIRYDLRLKAKDCLHRVRDFKALVLEENPLTEKKRTLESFKLIPRKW